MKRRLLDAALTVLRRDGAACLTVRNITAQAGCSTTGVYTYFDGKNGLVEAIYLDGFASFDKAVAGHLNNDDMLGAGHAYRRWALDNPMHYLVMFGSAVPEYVPSEAARTAATRSFDALVAAVRRLGAGERAEAEAYHVYATVHGYVMLELVQAGPDSGVSAESLFAEGLTHLSRSAAWAEP